MEYYLKTSGQDFKEALTKYRKDLSFVPKWFAGPAVDKIVKEALEETAKKLETKPASKTFISRMAGQLKSELKKLTNGILDNVFNRQIDKFKRFKNEIREKALSAKDIEKLDSRLRIIKTRDNRKFLKVDLNESWDKLQKIYGEYDMIQYRDKKFYPLDAYIKGKARTTTMETQIRASELDAARLDIRTGKVSAHNAPDTCRLFENAIFFYTQTDKNNFLKENPDNSVAKSWPTLRQLKDSQTHLFKFNCRHTISPIAIEDFSNSMQESFGKTRPLPKSLKDATAETKRLFPKAKKDPKQL